MEIEIFGKVLKILEVFGGNIYPWILNNKKNTNLLLIKSGPNLYCTPWHTMVGEEEKDKRDMKYEQNRNDEISFFIIFTTKNVSF